MLRIKTNLGERYGLLHKFVVVYPDDTVTTFQYVSFTYRKAKKRLRQLHSRRDGEKYAYTRKSLLLELVSLLVPGIIISRKD